MTYVHAAIARNGRAAERLAEAGNRDHLRAEHYADMLRRAGVVKESEPATARALIEGRVFVYGSADEIRDILQEYRLAGADEIALNLSGVYLTEGTHAALRDLDDILA